MTLTNRISIDAIRTDEGTQMRARIDDSVVDEYADLIKAGVTLPPVLCVFNDQHPWLVDGFHRLAAAKQAGEKDILAICNVGTQRDAILMSVGANADHGLRRTNEDKHRAVSTLLKDDEWGTWSDNEIAKRCHVSNHLVASLRKSHTWNSPSMNPASDGQERTFTHPKTGKPATMDTSNIGCFQPSSESGEPGEPEGPGVAGCEIESYDPPPPEAPEVPKASPEVPQDRLGNPITSPWVAATFGKAHELRDQARLLKQVKQSIRALVTTEQPIVAHLHHQQVDAALSQAIRTINEALPYAILPPSVTDEKYRKIGWLTKAQFERLPK